MSRYILFFIVLCLMGGGAIVSYLNGYSILSAGCSVITLVFLTHLYQRENLILRNYPVIGLIRSFLIVCRPIIRRYILVPFKQDSPYTYEKTNLVYERAKGNDALVSFGLESGLYTPGSEWIAHSVEAKEPPGIDRIKIGGSKCSKPYHSSRLNLSAMGYATLSENAVIALNLGAKLGQFAQNTGEDGICSFHKAYGGDLIWQIGTEFSGCRTPDRQFDFHFFENTSQSSQVKMIEIKLSQGAKPGVGGLFKEFKTFNSLLSFVKELRELSGSKPIGLKMCIGKPEDFLNLCNEMVRTEILVDYIQVDGAEGGTIGAPWELINSVGMPFWDGVHFVHSALSQKGLRNEITVLGSGKILTGFDIFKAIALGADGCCIARGMLLALGCVQAGKCKEGKCPAGIASPNGYRSKAIAIKQKARGVANYHNATLQAFDMLLGVAGLGCADQITPDHIYKRLSDGSIKNYNQILSTTGIIQV